MFNKKTPCVLSLRALSAIVVLLLTGLVLITASALILLTTYIRGTADSLNVALESVRIAESLKIELLNYQRESNLRLLMESDDQDKIRQRLVDLLKGARGYISSADEAEIVQRVEVEIGAYLAARDTEELHSQSLPEVLRATSDRFDIANTALDELVHINLAQAKDSREQAARWDHLGDVLGAGAILLLVLGVLLILYGLRTFIHRPLLALQGAIKRFSQGDNTSRAQHDGSTELREISQAFNNMAESLERQHSQRLIFLSGVAHDLRNPLGALHTSAQLLASWQPQNGDPSRILDLLMKEVARLDRMVGDLLDTVRIESGQLELILEEHDLRESARAVFELYLLMASEHELVLSSAQEEVKVSCDSNRIEQVLGNLVSNAIKYSQPGSRVEIKVESRGKEALLEVIDQGTGIEEEALPKLFEPFQRVGTASKQAPGVGLGLSVAKRIVEAHGGRIAVESSLGYGAKFQVWLPRCAKGSA
jgi:two-component system sensor histidine kinase MtrB